ncbi:MAG: ATP-binding cassette domain-containing protein [Pseudomonadota bacterium]|nr:ATP-binding cassette domain-containing protein [Pseudomonadota bacterium]
MTVAHRPYLVAGAISGDTLVTLRGVSKSFGSTTANADISLAIGRGEVLGLVGGNGAGKSTLMRVLCGVTRPDEGQLEFAGRSLEFEFYSAADAQAIGIRIVHQELSLCANLTVAENFFLETPEAASWAPGWRSAYRRRARAALDAVFPGNSIEVDRPLSALPIGQRQMVEIARAAATPNVKLIILDEPTSSLGPERSQQLRGYIQSRADKGVSFIFISHKLFEIMDVAERIAVMRNGRLVWHGGAKQTAVSDLVRMMGGEAAALPASLRAAPDLASSPVRVRIEGEIVAPLGRAVELHESEIVGFAGLEGSGQKELLHAIFIGASGGRNAAVERRGAASFVSGDRLREGVFPLWSVLANIGLSRIAVMPMFAFLSQADERSAAAPSAERLRLDVARLRSGMLDLSGGNQQKALVARALVADAPIILLDDPTRGVDVAAKRDFYNLTAEIARSGRLIVWHSTEDVEFLECDRVFVFAGGGIVAELVGDEISEQAIVEASFRAASERPSALGQKRAGGWSMLLIEAAPFLSLAAVLAVMLSQNSRIASVFGLDLLFWPAVPVALVSLAQMFVVGGSEIDLGVGAFAGLINVVSATWLVDSLGAGLLALVAGPLAYAALGALIQIRKIPAIVVTLGASFIWSGLAYTMQPTPGGSSPGWLTAAIGWSIPGAPTAGIVLVLIAAAAYLLNATPLGVALRAFGGNSTAMARAGWSASKYAALRYFLAGVFAALAGLSLTAINTASDYNAGGGYTLLSVASIVIGGCALAGGYISPLGVVAGSVTLSLIGALLGMLNVSPDYNAAVQGLLLLGMLVLRSAANRGRRDA